MLYKGLAIKYRPKNFNEIIGQNYITKSLINSIKKEKIYHSYLFFGPKGTGKTSLSRIFAKSLNCLYIDKNSNNVNPCNYCESCVLINKFKFIDCIEIDAASNRNVEEIDIILKQSLYKPIISKFKIYIIDEVHMLSIYAFNAMLKILEEPPKYILFILITTNIKKIPQTILSRCIKYNFKKISFKKINFNIKNILNKEKIKFEFSAINLISLNSEGSMRDALLLIDQALFYTNKILKFKIVKKILGYVDIYYLIQILKAIFYNNSKKILKIINFISKYNISYNLILKELSLILYNISLIQLNPIYIYKLKLYKKQIIKLSYKFSLEEIHFFYKIIIYGIKELNINTNEYSSFSIILLRMLVFLPLFSNNLKNIYKKYYF